MVQRTGFEPAKHYALGPHPSPFDHSGTSAWRHSDMPIVFHNLGRYKSFSHESISSTSSPTDTIPSSTTEADQRDHHSFCNDQS